MKTCHHVFKLKPRRGSSVGRASFKGPNLVQLFWCGFQTRCSIAVRKKILVAPSGDRSDIIAGLRNVAKKYSAHRNPRNKYFSVNNVVINVSFKNYLLTIVKKTLSRYGETSFGSIVTAPIPFFRDICWRDRNSKSGKNSNFLEVTFFWVFSFFWEKLLLMLP